MNWLIWKEYRLNRLILIVGAVLLILPHAIALVLTWRGVGPGIVDRTLRMSNNFLVAGIYSLVISQLTLALLGGHAIAGERVDRSAEFLGYLPLSRAKNLAGKIILALVAFVVIWVPNLLIFGLATSGSPEILRSREFSQGWIKLGVIAVTGLVFFGVGWLLSSVLESPTISICGGLITPLLVITGIMTAAWLFMIPSATLGSLVTPLYAGICFVLAPVCFVVGTAYYLRRVEP
jgi:ABC-type transport system involved in multi-copper enzyme maturation permease subunit